MSTATVSSFLKAARSKSTGPLEKSALLKLTVPAGNLARSKRTGIAGELGGVEDGQVAQNSLAFA